MFCSSCGSKATIGMRYCKQCGENLFTTNHLDDSPRLVSNNSGWVAFFLAAATVAIVLGGFGIITEFVSDLMTPKPFAPMQTDFDDNLAVAIPMIVLGSGTIFATVFLIMRLFSRMMNFPQDRKSQKQKSDPPIQYQQPPPIQAAPHSMSSVTEHTTRNFDPVPMKERPIHE
jgi:hypothetical protein